MNLLSKTTIEDVNQNVELLLRKRETTTFFIHGIVIEISVVNFVTKSEKEFEEKFKFLRPGHISISVSAEQLYKMYIQHVNKTPAHRRDYLNSVINPNRLEAMARQERARCCAELIACENKADLDTGDIFYAYFQEEKDGTLRFAYQDGKGSSYDFYDKTGLPHYRCLQLGEYLVSQDFCKDGARLLGVENTHNYRLLDELNTLVEWLSEVKSGNYTFVKDKLYFGHKLILVDSVDELKEILKEEKGPYYCFSLTDVLNRTVSDLVKEFYYYLILRETDKALEQKVDPNTLVAIHFDGYLVTTEGHKGPAKSNFEPLWKIPKKLSAAK